MDFSKKIYSKESSTKRKLINALQGEDERMFRSLQNLRENDWKRIIYWGGKHDPTISEHLNLLMDHEVMHHGQLIVYWKILNLGFPKSWKDWGL